MNARRLGGALDGLIALVLIALGAYHTLAGGALLARWMAHAEPALSPVPRIEVLLGFELGGYLAIALGVQQLLCGARATALQHRFWAATYAALAGLSLLKFGVPHPSQALLLVGLLLAARAWLTTRSAP